MFLLSFLTELWSQLFAGHLKTLTKDNETSNHGFPWSGLTDLSIYRETAYNFTGERWERDDGTGGMDEGGGEWLTYQANIVMLTE